MCGATPAGTLRYSTTSLFSIGPINYRYDSKDSNIAITSASTVHMGQSSISNIGSESISKKRRLCSSNSNNINDQLSMKVHTSVIIDSAPYHLKKRKIQHIMSSSPRSRSPTTVVESTTCNDSNNNMSSCSPHQAVLDVLSSRGREAIVRPSLNVTNFFLQHTQEQITAYDVDVIQAIRSQDIDMLRSMYKAGRPLQCANRFGESLIHMACRRGFVNVVRFLVDEAGFSLKVRDDYGRTPLHDACWACEPNEELVELLMLQCPELLLMSDKRGNTPFEYVRSEHWARWVHFLQNIANNF